MEPREHQELLEETIEILEILFWVGEYNEMIADNNWAYEFIADTNVPHS